VVRILNLVANEIFGAAHVSKGVSAAILLSNWQTLDTGMGRHEQGLAEVLEAFVSEIFEQVIQGHGC
jgi:hypothetical protein